MQDPRYPFEIVTIAASHAILNPLVIEALGSKGFEEVHPLRWVRSTDAPIRQMFCFFQWKGGMLAPSWGLSLDFVPHVSGHCLKWHRTPKSAMMDLRVDSRDRELDIPYHDGPHPSENALRTSFGRQWRLRLPSGTSTERPIACLKDSSG